MALIMSAVKHGAIVANYCEVLKLNKGPNGKINGARVKDNLTGEEWNIRTKVNLLPLSPHLISELLPISRELSTQLVHSLMPF